MPGPIRFSVNVRNIFTADFKITCGFYNMYTFSYNTFVLLLLYLSFVHFLEFSLHIRVDRAL